MKKSLVILFGALFLLGLSGMAQATLTQWTGPGANNHWYDVIKVNDIYWTTADLAASNASGYLATSTSAEENAFIVGLINGLFSSYDPGDRLWLGGFYTGTGDDWIWKYGGAVIPIVNGTSPYANWYAPNEPNNYKDGTGTEDYLAIGMGFTQAQIDAGAVPGLWRSTANDADTIIGYVVEYDCNPVPIPAAVWLLGSGVLGLVALGRRRLMK